MIVYALPIIRKAIWNEVYKLRYIRESHTRATPCHPPYPRQHTQGGGCAPAHLRVCAAARTHHHPAAWTRAHRAQGSSTHSGGRTAAPDQHGGISWNTGTAAGRLQTHTLRIEYLCYHYAIISALFHAITLCFKQNESFVYNPNNLQT